MGSKKVPQYSMWRNALIQCPGCQHIFLYSDLTREQRDAFDADRVCPNCNKPIPFRRRYLVQSNCYFTLSAELPNSSEAIIEASKIPIDRWDQDWQDPVATEMKDDRG